MARGSLLQWLAEPAVRAVDVDSDDLLEVHRQVLLSKPMIRGVFDDLYDACMAADRQHLRGDGLRVEIGAGVSRFKERYPRDHHRYQVLAVPRRGGRRGGHAVCGWQRPRHPRDQRVPPPADPDRFFNELERVLAPGGGAILIDPYHGPFARLVYPRLFATEGYDLTQSAWELPDGSMGVMQGANQALSWIVFVRDADRLRSSHPGLELVHMRPLTNYPRYLVSGGLNFRQLLPDLAIPVLRAGSGIGAPRSHDGSDSII